MAGRLPTVIIGGTGETKRRVAERLSPRGAPTRDYARSTASTGVRNP